jgi:peptidoglycan-associated lipoprotein
VKKAIVVLLLCAGCPARVSYPECKADEGCAEHGQVCANGFCRECRDDASCAAKPGRPLCQNGLCAAKPECDKDADCGGGRRCAQNRCIAECSENNDCGEGRHCAAGRCADDTCEGDADCSNGAACVERRCRPQGWNPGNGRFGRCKLSIVHFGFDDATLTPEARTALSNDWQCLQQNSYRRVVLAGHSDERGTTEYNLALGERRADAVRKYLVGLGAEPRRLKTISFGMERPLDPGHDDAAWARNRRVELVPEP